MDDIKILVPAIPVAQPRPRSARINGKTLTISNPVRHPVSAFKATCRVVAHKTYKGPPLEGPLGLSLLFVMPRVGKSKVKSRVPHDKRPDFDNLAKSCTDALTGLLWRDDNQLYEVRVSKVRAAWNEQPHVEIVVWKPEE